MPLGVRAVTRAFINRAQRGLYAGRQKLFGNKISEDGGNKCEPHRSPCSVDSSSPVHSLGPTRREQPQQLLLAGCWCCVTSQHANNVLMLGAFRTGNSGAPLTGGAHIVSSTRCGVHGVMSGRLRERYVPLPGHGGVGTRTFRTKRCTANCWVAGCGFGSRRTPSGKPTMLCPCDLAHERLPGYC